MTQITNCKLCNVRANDSTSALPHQRRLHIYANGSLTKYCSNINIQHLTQCFKPIMVITHATQTTHLYKMQTHKCCIYANVYPGQIDAIKINVMTFTLIYQRKCKWRIDITAKKWRIDETGHPPQTQTTQQLFYI